MRFLSREGKTGEDAYSRAPFALSSETLAARRDENRRRREEKAGECLVSTLANEIMFAELMFIPSENGPLPWKKGMPRYKVWHSQVGFYLDDIVVGFCGRDIGKTFSMLTTMPQRMVFYERSNAIFTSHDEVHVKEPINKLLRVLDTHPFLTILVDRSRGARKADGALLRQYMANGYVLYGISAGKTEAGSAKMEAPHVNSVYIDETQEFSRWGWQKLLPARNDMRENHMHGACLKAFGVNSQGRVDTVFYDLAHRWTPFKHHTYRIASWLTPRYSIGRHIEALETYGGSVEATDFKQMMRGLTGERSRGTFSEESYMRCVELHEKMALPYRFRRIGRKQWDLASGDPAKLFDAHLKEPDEYRQCIIAADYGTTAPTVIGLWYEMDHPEKPDETVFALTNVIEVLGVLPHDQIALFDWLDDVLHPTWITVDSSSSTDHVYRSLTDPGDVRYNHKNYKDRLFPASSNRPMTVDYVTEKPPDGISTTRAVVNGMSVYAVKAPAKVFQMNEIVRLMGEKKLAIPGDESMKREFLSVVTKESANNHITYSGGGGQHVISMFRCLVELLHSVYTLKEREARVGDRFGDDVPAPLCFQIAWGRGGVEKVRFT